MERAPMKIDPTLSKTAPRNAPINPGTDPLAIPPAAPATKAPATSNGAVPLAQ
jgi:hypothetical protein